MIVMRSVHGADGPEQCLARAVIDPVIVGHDKARASGQAIPAEQLANMAASGAELTANMERTSESMFCSAHMMDDGIIDPADTRNVLLFTLETCLETTHRGTRPNTFGVARF